MATEVTGNAATDESVDDKPPPTTELWTVPWRDFGYQEVLRGLGTIVTPLLAGFSLAAIATIVTADTTPPLASWALAALAADVALLLLSMQISVIALARGSPPETYVKWYPEATMKDEALAFVREKQAADFVAFVRLGGFARTTFGLGLSAFLAGVLLLLVPQTWSTPRVLAFAVTAVVLFLETWWAVANLASSVGAAIAKLAGSLGNAIQAMPHPQTFLEGKPDPDPLAKLRLKPFDQLDSASKDALRNTSGPPSAPRTSDAART